MTAAGVAAALRQLAAGGIVVVVDDPDREDEGDLVAAAELTTPATIAFLAGYGRGLICAPLSRARLAELEVPAMPSNSGDPLGTAFHTGVDHAAGGTGISAADRARTVRALADPATGPAELRLPGHVFPLAAHPDGVFGRRGHTEASIDLVRLAGLRPAAVICEIVRPDGTMARLPDLVALADRHDLPILTVDDVVAHRRAHDPLVERGPVTSLPLDPGRFRAVGYRGRQDGTEHLVLLHGDPAAAAAPLVRIHTECLAGDVLGSRACPCRAGLRRDLAELAAAEAGALVYLRPPRDAFTPRLVDPADHQSDPRSATLAGHILHDLGITRPAPAAVQEVAVRA